MTLEHQGCTIDFENLLQPFRYHFTAQDIPAPQTQIHVLKIVY